MTQETFLSTKNKVKFNRYSIIRINRITLRKTNRKARAGGVIILIKILIKNNQDNTIEISRVRLHVKANNKLFLIDILNMYILLMHRGDKNNKKSKILVPRHYLILFYKII